jgi:glycosyltransferase involved in cell wall biosynthesis
MPPAATTASESVPAQLRRVGRWNPAAGAVAVIPALDEEAAIGGVIAALPADRLRGVVVADNGSRDRTARVAAEAGASVVYEPRRGYGRACLAALDHLRRQLDGPPPIVVFLDADASDDPADLAALLAPIERGAADLVIGSRTRGGAEAGAITPVQRFGNALATRLIRWTTGTSFTDLGPFRAVAWEALERLDMCDLDYGWTVEMQVKAARRGLRIAEVPVRYRRRVGRSKISGTVRGAAAAGVKILYTVAREAVRR